MHKKLYRAGVLASLVVTSAVAQGCSSGTTTSGTASAPVAGISAPAPAPVASTSAPAVAAKLRPLTKSTPLSKPTASKAVKLPDASTLVTISITGRRAALVDAGKGDLSASERGTPLRFHLIGFDDDGDYQISLAGSKRLCLEQAYSAGSVRLAKCDVDSTDQRFTITAAATGFYLGNKTDEFLYQGVGDVAAFNVTPDFEPDHWTFTGKGTEPLD
jgi:hypothetical protein